MPIRGGMIDKAIQQRSQAPGYNENILGSFGNLLGGIGNLLEGRPYLSGRDTSQIPQTFFSTNRPLTQITSSQAPRLEQYNPPGFDPNQPVTVADLRKTAQEAGLIGSAPIAPPVPQLSPQDRAYQQERARVEAMVKSNPDMQKQEIAEARAKVRDKGMEEWAKANPDLAAKVMPGQSGFSAIQGFVGGVGAPTTGPASAALQASPELNPASPTFAGGEGAPILRELSPELIKQYQEQLLKQAK
jgi:hypothetical protein